MHRAEAADRAAWRRGALCSLRWSLWFGGWLVLAPLGRQLGPLQAEGLLPLALGLAVLGLGLHRGRGPLATAGARTTVLLTTALGGLALGAVARGAGTPALALAAVAWGLLMVAATRAARAARRASPCTAGPAMPMALGALLAWLLAGDLTAAPLSAALGLLGAGLALCALLPAAAPPCGATRRPFDRPRPRPAGPAFGRPEDWMLASARWTMLPMMATLGSMADWCGAGSGGAGAAGMVGLHLLAMLLPLLLLPKAPRAGLRPVDPAGAAGTRGTGLRDPAWVGLPMVGGLVLFVASPGAQGWMAVSLCHALAWGLSAACRPGPADGPSPALPSRGLGDAGWAGALGLAAAALGLGLALAAFGAPALAAVHAALALIALIAAIAMLSRLATRASLLARPPMSARDR